MSNEIEWPREIWMAELDEHHNGRGDVVLSVFGAVDSNRDHHRYVDGDIFDSHEKYTKHQIETLRGLLAQHCAKTVDAEKYIAMALELQRWEAEAEGAAAIIMAERSEVARLRAENARLREALSAIEVHGSDTLSGPVPPQRNDVVWARDGIREMVRRARAGRAGQQILNEPTEAPDMSRPGDVIHET